jgi:hypothetical protein
MQRVRLTGLAALCLLVVDGPLLAGELGKQPLSESRTRVLGGHLTVRMPKGAKVEARPHALMSAPEPEEHETRVVLDDGNERLVLLAREAFAFAGSDFEGSVRRVVADWERHLGGKYGVRPKALQSKGCRAVSVVPAAPDRRRSDDAAFIAGLFVASADGTVQTLDVYVNPAAAADPAGCAAIAEKVLSSVAPGPKPLRLAAGERRLDAFSDEVEIAVTVPEGTAATKQAGPDFLVHRLIALGPLGGEQSSVGIYLGDHPDFRPGPSAGEGTLFGKKVRWHASADGKGLEATCEVPLPGGGGRGGGPGKKPEAAPPDPGGPPLIAHVWIQAADQDHLRALRRAAESTRLVKRRPTGAGGRREGR